jgi:hypothetical protein
MPGAAGQGDRQAGWQVMAGSEGPLAVMELSAAIAAPAAVHREEVPARHQPSCLGDRVLACNARFPMTCTSNCMLLLVFVAAVDLAADQAVSPRLMGVNSVSVDPLMPHLFAVGAADPVGKSDGRQLPHCCRCQQLPGTAWLHTVTAHTLATLCV